MNTSFKLSKRLSFGEEIANSVTHAVGAFIMLICSLSHRLIVMKLMGFYRLSVCPSSSSASFSCSYHQLFIILWLMVQLISTCFVSSTIL